MTIKARIRHAVLRFDKIRRVVWGYLKGPVIMHALVDECGYGASVIGRRPVIVNAGKIHIGYRFRMQARTRRTEITVEPGGSLEIGNDSTINQGVQIYVTNRVSLGSRVAVSSGVHIYDTNSHAVGPGDGVRSEPIEIGDDVWIGMNAILLPGAKIDRGAVIGAGSLVNFFVPEGAVVAPPRSSPVRKFDVPVDYWRRDNGPSLSERLRGIKSVKNHEKSNPG